MEQTKYTVFATCTKTKCDSFECNTKSGGAPTGQGLQDRIAYFIEEGFTPKAWAMETPEIYGGSKGWRALRAESIAAGRTIELIDGKYVPRGVEEDKPKEMFRIGGVYRQQCGRVVRLVDDMWDAHREKWGAVHPEHKFVSAVDVAVGSCHGYVSLMNGKYVHGFVCPAGENLLPGELYQVDGQWLPVKENGFCDALAKDAADDLMLMPISPEEANAPMLARDTDRMGSKVVSTPVRFDPFKDFIVKSGSIPQPQSCGMFSPDLEKASHQLRGVHGSAWLLKG